MTLPESEECQRDSPPTKRIRLDETSGASTSCNSSGLLNFCDDLMLEIFSYVSPIDLLALSLCCHRLQRVVCDRTLWTNVDFRPLCLSDKELRKYVKFFLPSTKLIAIKGPWQPSAVTEDQEPQLPEPNLSISDVIPSFTGELLESIKRAAPNLTTLILDSHIIDSQDLTWDKVPETLEHLSLRGCHVINLGSTLSFFFGIDKSLRNLKSLDLTNCPWFESHSFLALSKCNQLQELRLADCLLCDFVPYVSLGTRFGFKELTVVDFRRTWVSDREVSCLNKTPTLRELYLESPEEIRGTMLISDLAVTSFGGNQQTFNEMGFILVLNSNFEGFKPVGLKASPLRVIQMSNYVTVTDTSLRHCASCLKGLKQLNVKGTSCTQAGVIKFKSQRPDVLIESNYDLEVPVDSSSNVNNT